MSVAKVKLPMPIKTQLQTDDCNEFPKLPDAQKRSVVQCFLSEAAD
jgi:hypothetical protein